MKRVNIGIDLESDCILCYICSWLYKMSFPLDQAERLNDFQRLDLGLLHIVVLLLTVANTGKVKLYSWNRSFGTSSSDSTIIHIYPYANLKISSCQKYNKISYKKRASNSDTSTTVFYSIALQNKIVRNGVE